MPFPAPVFAAPAPLPDLPRARIHLGLADTELRLNEMVHCPVADGALHVEGVSRSQWDIVYRGSFFSRKMKRTLRPLLSRPFGAHRFFIGFLGRRCVFTLNLRTLISHLLHIQHYLFSGIAEALS
jgi:hypothetical protein